MLLDQRRPRRGGTRVPARLAAFKQRCRELGLRLTVQRRLVLEAILELPAHPTADQVFEAVAGRMPGISRTTIYRTLEQLVRTGVIGKACHPGRSARYDVRTDLHHHLVCMECDEMVDISDAGLDALVIPDTSVLGFEVQDFRVQLRGLCRRCKARRRKEDAK